MFLWEIFWNYLDEREKIRGKTRHTNIRQSPRPTLSVHPIHQNLGWCVLEMKSCREHVASARAGWEASTHARFSCEIQFILSCLMWKWNTKLLSCIYAKHMLCLQINQSLSSASMLRLSCCIIHMLICFNYHRYTHSHTSTILQFQNTCSSSKTF